MCGIANICLIKLETISNKYCSLYYSYMNRLQSIKVFIYGIYSLSLRYLYSRSPYIQVGFL